MKKLLPVHMRRFIRKIEVSHKGLGIPFLLQYICYEGKVSILWIGSKGTGKSVIIENSKPINNTWVDVNLYQVTKGKMSEYLSNVSDTTIVLRITELAQLSQYQRNLFLEMIGTIITSRNFDYTLSNEKKIYIRNSDLIVSAGIQPLTFSKMVLENLSWSEFASDRLLKLQLINPIRETTIEEPPQLDLKELYSRYNPAPKMPKKLDFSKLENLLKGQLTTWRAKSFARKLALGFTKLLGQKKVTQKVLDVLFILLYPYVYPFNRLNLRTEIGEERQIWAAGLELFNILANYFGVKGLEGVTKRELAKELGVTVRAVEKTLAIFKELELDIIENHTVREGKTQRAYIKLSEPLRKFFTNYNKLFY